jgi:hypothetical protein
MKKPPEGGGLSLDPAEGTAERIQAQLKRTVVRS